jgi:hypothetical protein
MASIGSGWRWGLTELWLADAGGTTRAEARTTVSAMGISFMWEP